MIRSFDIASPEEGSVRSLSYGAEEGWVNGAYHARERTAAAVPVRRGPGGGILLRASFEVEENASLDGTRATVAQFPRYRGEAACLTGLRACACELTVALHNPGSVPAACCMVVNDFPQAAVQIAPGAIKIVSFTAQLDRRYANLMVVPAKEDASEPCAGELEIELMRYEARELSCERGPQSAIFIAADSLAQTYEEGVRPQTGWGEYLASYLAGGAVCIQRDDACDYAPATVYAANGLTVRNRAMGGRSARSFAEERKLEAILRDIRPGDVLLIQFGANDATAVRPARYTPPERFAAELTRYVDGALDREATPVLITPPPRYHFDAQGRELLDFAEYADVERTLARERGVPLIDLSREGADLLNELGPELATSLYLKVSAGQFAAYPDGADDSTHLSPVGARAFVRIVAQGLAAQVEGLSFFDDRPEGPEAPRHLVARVADERPASPSVTLSWDASDANDCYTVEKRAHDGATLWRALSVVPVFVDTIGEAQDAPTSYVVTAWRATRASAGVEVTVNHRFEVAACTAEGIGGFSLYEIDESIVDRTGFSVRFAAADGVERYRVVATNAQTNRALVLGTIDAAEVDGLHSYAINNEPGWRVRVEGANAAGATVRSRELEVPCHDARPGSGKASWEAPF